MAAARGGDLERVLKVVFNTRGGYSEGAQAPQALNSRVDGELAGQTLRGSVCRAHGRARLADYPHAVPRVSIVLAFTLLFAACTAPDPKPSDTAKPEPQPNASAQPDEPDPKADEGWQRGTITVGPDGLFAIHADDDSATVCAFDELGPELQQKDLAVRFRGELIPPAPNERRWCTLAKDLVVEKAP